MKSQKAAARLCELVAPAREWAAWKAMLTAWRFGSVASCSEEVKIQDRNDSMRLRLFGNLIRVVSRNHLAVNTVRVLGGWRHAATQAQRGAVSEQVSSALEQLKNTLHMAEEAAGMMRTAGGAG